MTFTDSEKQIILDWLSGSSDYKVDSKVYYTDNPAQTSGYRSVSVYDARFKIYGCDVDFNYRIPTLSCTWKNFGFIPNLKKYTRRFRFYLQVDLVNRSSNRRICLLRSLWFSIKSYKILPTTSDNTRYKDIVVQGVPRIYEYNRLMKWGPKNYGDWMDQFSEDGLYRTPKSICKLVKTFLDASLITSISDSSYSVAQTAPCPDSGPRILRRNSREDGFSEDSLEGFPVNDFGKSGEYSFLALFGKALVMTGCMFIPEQYSRPLSQSDDVPTFSVDDLRSLFTLFVDEGRYISDLNDFSSTESSDTSMYEEVNVSYRLTYYGVASPRVYESAGINTLYGESLYGLIKGGPLLLSYQYQEDDPVQPDEAEIRFIQQAIVESPQQTTYDYKFRWDVLANKDGFEYFTPPPAIDNYGIKIGIASYQRSETYIYVSSESDSSTNVVEVDTSMLDYWKLARTLYHLYARVKGRVSFTAEWRPWINIHDVIKVTYMNELGVFEVAKIMVISVDANLDTFTANYVGLIIPGLV